MNDEQHKSLPPLLTQVSTLVLGVGQHIFNSCKEVNEKIFEFRYAICNDCESLIDDDKCVECGCIMKLKTKWEAASCPIKKW